MMLVLLVLVALGCGPGLGSRLSPMWYHPYPKTWANARTKCQSDHGGDLLTLRSEAELNLMDLSSFYAWIGLFRHYNHYHWGTRTDTNQVPGIWATPVGELGAGLGLYRDHRPHSAHRQERHFFLCADPLTDVFVPQTLSWDDAQDFCQSQGLSRFDSRTDLRWPGSPFYTPQEFPVWIGLRSSGGSWSWGDGQQSDYRNWHSALGSDPGPDPNTCVSVGSQSKSMTKHHCNKAFPFVCYKPGLVLLQELLSWEQAVDHCKNLSSSSSFRLLSVDQSNMDTIKNVLRFAHTTKVWVGLRFLAGFWFWSDDVPVSLSLPSCPQSTLGCGALVFSDSSDSDPVVEPSDCSEKLNLLCYDPAL